VFKLVTKNVISVAKKKDEKKRRVTMTHFESKNKNKWIKKKRNRNVNRVEH
jgi:3-methyladenine DNA glycosylase AlkC